MAYDLGLPWCYHVQFYTPLPNAVRTDAFDLNPSITALEITSQLPGGWNTLQLTVKRLEHNGKYFSQFPKPVDIKPRGHVEVFVGQFRVFRGTVIKRVTKGGEIIQVTAVGYGIAGLNDDWYKNNEVNVTSAVSQIQTTQRTAGQVIADAINSAAPLIKLGNSKQFMDPGTILVPGSFYGQTPAQIIEAVTKMGSSLNIVWDTWVYEDEVLYLQPRALTGDAMYSIPEDDSVTLTEDYQQITGQVRVEYKLPEWDSLDKEVQVPDQNGNYQTTDEPNPDFQGRYGIMKRTYLKAGELTTVVAQQLASTYLLDHFDPIDSAVIDRDPTRGLETAAGGEVPGYMVRSGQWVKVGDHVPLIVVRTRLNEQGYQYELGKSAQHWEAMVSYLNEVARHVVMSTNPLSGLRA